jgi:hypothetical protein
MDRNDGGRRTRAAGGFTLVELMIGMLASSIMVLGVMNVLASNQKEYNQTYERVNGRLEREATEARVTFEVVVRRATVRTYRIWVDGAGNQCAEVYYYHDNDAGTLDRYGKFYFNPSDNTLSVEYGDGHFAWNGTENLWYYDGSVTSHVIAHDVTGCIFTQAGPTLSMAVVLDDGRLDLPIVVTATRHNE